MPTLTKSDQSVEVQVVTTTDKAGVNDAKKGIESIGDEVVKTGKKASDFSDNFAEGLKKVRNYTAVAGAALTLYSKSATDLVTDMYSSAKALARETGSSEVEASKLLAVTKKLGIGSDQTSASFGILSKQITAANDATGENAIKQKELQAQLKDTALKHDELNNKIEKNKIAMKEVTEEIKKHGDGSGVLKNKLDALKLSTQGYENELSGLTTETEKLNLEMKKTSNPLERIGVATKDATGKSRDFNDILMDVADRFKEMPNGAEKSALSMELFGRSGKDMIKVLNLGSDGIKDMEQQAERLGLTLTKDNIAGMQAYIASQKRMKDSTDSLKIAVGTATAPVMASFNEAVAQVTENIMATNGPLKSAVVNILAFGGPVLGAVSAVASLGGNLASMGLKLSSLSFLLNPWVLALTAAAVAIGFVAHALGESNSAMNYHLQNLSAIGRTQESARIAVVNHNSALNTLAYTLSGASAAINAAKVADEGLTKASNDLKYAQDGVKNSALDITGAQLQVERAQRNYTDAVKQYGPAALESREAANQLEQAKAHLRDTTKDAADKQAELTQKEKDYNTKKDEFKKAMGERDEAIKNQKGLLDSLGDALERAAGKAVSNPVSRAGIKGILNAVHLPAFAGGVTNFSGGPALVGEQGPEVVDLPKGATVHTASESKGMMQNSGSSSQSIDARTIIYGNVIIPDMNTAHNTFNALDIDSLLLSKGLTPSRGSA